jgi:pimeloyl-ACP methyl ester carboxylesterase
MRRWFLALTVLVAAAVAAPPLFFALFPVEVPDLPAPGRRISVGGDMAVNALVRGDGSAVVLIHGLPGTAYNWQAVSDRLALRGHRVVAYDRVGYGRSDRRSADDFSVDANARELLALLEAEDLRDTTVVGWSYGGKTAMTAALSDSSRIGRLVLVGSAGFWDSAPPPSRLFSILFSAPVVEWMAAVPPLFRGMQQAMGVQFFSEQPVPGWFSLQSRANFALSTTRHTWRQEAARFRFDGPDPAPIDRPILVIHGDDDRVIPLEVGEWIHARAPRSELLVVEGGSHALPATHPVLVADRIEDFAAR